MVVVFSPASSGCFIRGGGDGKRVCLAQMIQLVKRAALCLHSVAEALFVSVIFFLLSIHLAAVM